ncbi:hypothetical protein M758_UG210300 [Ceratodon purpureus]|nr:hypothetical protein M758_UG210300 [Ceratodon purpureus]
MYFNLVVTFNPAGCGHKLITQTFQSEILRISSLRGICVKSTTSFLNPPSLHNWSNHCSNDTRCLSAAQFHNRCGMIFCRFNFKGLY